MLGKLTTISRYSVPPIPLGIRSPHVVDVVSNNIDALSFITVKIQARKLSGWRFHARRRVIYEEDNDDDEYGYNEEIALLEMYTQSVKDEVLFVKAKVDDDENVEVLVFKGISSCLSYTTSPDPTRSVLPEKAIITSIDRISGPFDPSNVQYIERGLTFDGFKDSLIHNK